MNTESRFTFELEIEINHPVTGWKLFKILRFKSQALAEKRFYRFAEEYFRAYPHASKLRGTFRDITKDLVIDVAESSAADFS